MSGGSSAPSGNTTTTQTTNPWPGQIPYLTGGTASNGSPIQGVMQSAASLYNAGGPQYFPGQTYAGPTGAQTAAIGATENLGLNGSPITGAAQRSTMGILDPSFRTSNPGNAIYSDLANGADTQAAINSAVQQATPGLLDTFTQGNRLNSPAAANYVAQGVTTAAAPYVLQGKEAAAQGLSQNYSTAAGQQNTAALLSPSVQNMSYTDLQNAYGAGQTQQALGQQSINDQIARWNYQQTEPYNLLNWYGGAVGGNYGSTATLTTPYFQQQSGGWGGALSGAASGAAIGSMFGPGYGTAIGAVAGGLLGGFA